MVLGDLNLVDDGDGGGKVPAVSCSICMELVTDGERSWSKLVCGHRFHLDCIGSAFNVKGVMQCPNCRKIEKGRWLFANGNRSPLHELNVDDLSWAHDDDFILPDLSSGAHWCPYGGVNRIPSSFDEPDVPPTPYHDHNHHIVHPPLFADPTPVPSIHPCTYVTYVEPTHPSFSTSSGTISDWSSSNIRPGSYSHEIPTTYAFPTMDAYYHSWDHSSHFVDQQHVNQRTAQNNSDITRQTGMMQPYTIGLGSRGPTSSAVPPYPNTVSRPHEHQPFFHHTNSIQVRPNSLTSNGPRNTNHMSPPVAPSSDQFNGFYFFSPTSSSTGRDFQEAENPVHDRFNGWEVDRDSIWGPFQTHENGNNVRQRQNRQNRS